MDSDWSQGGSSTGRKYQRLFHIPSVTDLGPGQGEDGKREGQQVKEGETGGAGHG